MITENIVQVNRAERDRLKIQKWAELCKQYLSTTNEMEVNRLRLEIESTGLVVPER